MAKLYSDTRLHGPIRIAQGLSTQCVERLMAIACAG